MPNHTTGFFWTIRNEVGQQLYTGKDKVIDRVTLQ